MNFKQVLYVFSLKKKFYIFVITMQSLNGHLEYLDQEEESESRVKLVRSGHKTSCK